MYNNYDYPCGADTPDAPWNQDNREPDYIERDVEVCISLSKTVTICTNDYIPTIEEDYDVDIDEDGNRVMVGGKFESQDFSDTNWNKAYQEDDCYIITLLQEYGEILKKEIATNEETLRNLKEEYKENPKNKLLKKDISRIENTLHINRNKVKACYGYTVDDLNVFEI